MSCCERGFCKSMIDHQWARMVDYQSKYRLYSLGYTAVNPRLSVPTLRELYHESGRKLFPDRQDRPGMHVWQLPSVMFVFNIVMVLTLAAAFCYFIFIYIFFCPHTYTHSHPHMHTHPHTPTHMHKHTYTHTHTHIYEYI